MSHWWEKLEQHAWTKHSQCGEEGILKHIFANIGTTNKILVDIGASDGYRLSNTRDFLDNGWNGFLFEGDPVAWNITETTAINVARVTSANVNALLTAPQKLAPNGVMATCPPNIDLLSLDIDSTDYWVWKALEVVKPRVVVIEFNAAFPADTSITIPNDPNARFDESLYFGASFTALARLGSKKGYILVGQVADSNMFFVHHTAHQFATIPQVAYSVQHRHAVKDAFERPWLHIFPR